MKTPILTAIFDASKFPAPAMTSPETNLTTEIGVRIRTARNSQRMSRAELSVRTDGALSKSRISNDEQGIRRLGLEEAQILAKALGTVSATYLLCLDDEGFLSFEELALVRCFRRTDRRRKDAILDAAESQCGALMKVS